jgi:hypothetical protein
MWEKLRSPNSANLENVRELLTEVDGFENDIGRNGKPATRQVNRATSSRGVSGRTGSRSPVWWKCEAARRSSTRAICRARCSRSAAVQAAGCRGRWQTRRADVTMAV